MSNCTWIGRGEKCTGAAVPGRSYCEHHLWQVYNKGSNLSRRKKDIRTVSSVRFWENLMNEAYEELVAEGAV